MEAVIEFRVYIMQAEKSVELLSEMMTQGKKIIEDVVIAPELIERETT